MKAVPVRVGGAYQAEIPPLTSSQHSDRPVRPTPSTPTGAVALSKCRQRWTPTRFSEQEVTEYLRLCRLHEIESGLQCLHDGDFQVEKAMRLLQNARSRTVRRQRTRDKLIDKKTFEYALTKYSKRFHLMKQDFDDAVSAKDLVDYYFTWKLTAAAAKWRERARLKRRGEVLQLTTDEEDEELSDDAMDYHNEYCDCCFTGGKLLCCDGCERAFHFSCVNPPIQCVPPGDWYCQYCVEVLRAKAIRRDEPHEQTGGWSVFEPLTADTTREPAVQSKQPQATRNETADDTSDTDRDASDEDQDISVESIESDAEAVVLEKESRWNEPATMIDPKSPNAVELLSRRKRQRKTNQPRRILSAT